MAGGGPPGPPLPVPGPGTARAFVADFGLAKSVATGSKLTRTGEALGTPAYMSPEQARGEVSSLTAATDVWSVGCVLYEMISGRAPFEGETDAAVVAKILLEPPPRLGFLGAEAPRGLGTVVRVCLAKDPRRRYPGTGALREDLDRVLRAEPPRVRVPGGWHWKAAAAVALAATAGWGAAAAWPRAGATSAASVPEQPSRVDSLAARACALRQTDPRRSADLLREALESEPRREDLRLERGLLLWAVGDGKEARDEWARVYEEPPEGAPEAELARLYSGLEALWRLGHEAGALGSPGAVPHLEATARAGGRAGRLAEGALAAARRAWPTAREALRGEPGWMPALLRGYVEGHDPLGDKALAVREYDQALEEGIPFGWAFSERGRAREDLGDFLGAKHDYGRALGIAPRHPILHLNLGNAKRALGDLAGALEAYERALAIDPRYAQAYGSRGNAKWDKGDLAGAIEDYSSLLEINPRDALAYSNRGAARSDVGDIAGAMADFEQALGIDPTFALAHYNRGNARTSLRKFREAISDYDHALKSDPNLAEAYNGRGRARVAVWDFGGALADFERVLVLAPPDSPAYRNALSNRVITREAQARQGGR
ncbi:MAG: tetratricopeptide repeat-containing serine/threonine-protein kinase [Planctomycetales bacterium]|nr:tetratricopeptide repeat-containing serine/threonine-protein kinase [Planctomycetales bacterium]